MTAVGLVAILSTGSGLALAQPPAAPGGTGAAVVPRTPQTPGGRAGEPGGRGGRGGGLLAPREPDDTAGFTRIFNGKSLEGWDGDTTFWRVENDTIVGESTAEKVVKQNTFLIWRGERVRNFELKLEYRMNGTNSGVQYRSLELPDVGRWVLRGYQADLDFTNQYTGNVHDERGRNFLSPRGTVTRSVEGGRFKLIGAVDDPDALKGYININGWNSYHIIARGSVLMHLVNNRLMAVFIDEDPARAVAEGVLGFQMHTGDPYKVEFRNIWYRRLQ
jgi:hypothetical protein